MAKERIEEADAIRGKGTQVTHTHTRARTHRYIYIYTLAEYKHTHTHTHAHTFVSPFSRFRQRARSSRDSNEHVTHVVGGAK